MTRTILTIAQQNQWCNSHPTTREHKWSVNGYGNSKIISGISGELIGKADGCGYDRFGKAIGHAMMHEFSAEIYKLAKRLCKGRRSYKQAPDFYGLFFDSITNRAWLDGACGGSCMRKILNKIGFTLEFIGDTGNAGRTGSAFYKLRPVTSHERKWL